MHYQTSTHKHFGEKTSQELLQFIGINYLQYIEKYGSKLQKLSHEDLIEMAEDKNESLK